MYNLLTFQSTTSPKNLTTIHSLIMVLIGCLGIEQAMGPHELYEQLLRQKITKPNCGQFHQRFLRAFFVQIFYQSQNITRKSCWNNVGTKNLYVKIDTCNYRKAVRSTFVRNIRPYVNVVEIDHRLTWHIDLTKGSRKKPLQIVIGTRSFCLSLKVVI